MYNLDQYFDKVAIQLNDDLYYLPNIFCNHTAFTFTENRSSIITVYINNKMLIIPGYCLMYVYNKFPVFSLQLNILNNIPTNITNIVNKFKVYDFFKIFNLDNEVINEELLNDEAKFIIFLQLIEQHFLTTNQYNFCYNYTLFNCLEKENKISITNEYLLNIYKQIKTKMQDKNIINYIIPSTYPNYNFYRDLQIIKGGRRDLYYEKYMKYKNKYLQLKEKYIF